MALTTIITGRMPLPTDQPSKAAELVFTLSDWDKSSGDIVPPASVRSVLLADDGTIPPGFALWTNAEGGRGTTYHVVARWVEVDRHRGAEPREAQLGRIYLTGPGPVVLADLLPLSVVVPDVPDALAQALGAAASAQAAAASTIPVLQDRLAAEAARDEAAEFAAASSEARVDAMQAEQGAKDARDAALAAGGWDQSVADEAARLALTGLPANWRVHQAAPAPGRIYRWTGSAWVDTGPSPLAPISAQAGRVDERSGVLAGLLTRAQIIGVAAPVTGTNASSGTQYVLSTSIENNGVARELRIQAGVAASVDVGVFSRSAADLFTRLRVVTVQVLPGLNVIPLDIAVSRGQYLGLASTTTGFAVYNTAANAGYFSGTLSGGAFTSASAATSLRIEAGFSIDLASGDKVEAVLTDQRVAAQVLGPQAVLADGSNNASGTYVMDGAALEDGILDAVEIRARVSATVTVGLWERRGATMTRVEVLGRVTVAPAVLNTIRIGKPIKRGQYVGYQSSTTGFSAIITGGVGGYFRSANAAASSFDVTNPITSAAPQLRAIITRGVTGSWHEVTLANVDKVLGIGPSYLASHYNQRGKGWFSKVSLFSDYNFEAFGLGGTSYASMLNTYIRPNNPVAGWGSGIGPQDIGSTWALLMMGWNDYASGSVGVSFDAYVEDMRQMVETVASLGANPILSTEWQPIYDTTNPSTHVVHKQVAGELDVPFIDMIPHTMKMRDGGGAFYAGFWQGGGAADVNHPGVRTNHIIADEAERQLAQILPRPKNALKIFRRRGSAAVASVDDLMFRDHFERASLWRELFLNQVALAVADEDHYDALGAGGYDPNSIIGSEYLRLRAGQSVTVEDYVLIDAVIDATLPQVQRLILSLGDPGITVWVRDALFSAVPADYPADGKSVARWVALTGDGSGNFAIEGRDLPGRMTGDRITFLLRKGATSWALRAPSIRWLGKSGKPERKPRPLRPARGAAVLARTDFAAALTGWTVTGSPVTSTDATTQFPTSATRIVTLAPGQALAQVLDYVPDPARDREVEIILTARRNPAVFAPGGDYATAPITQASFDWTRVMIDLIDSTGAFVMTQRGKVGLWWDDVRIRTILPLRAPALTLRLRAEATIEIAAVTARLID